jgi:hypothetical protein
MSAGPNIFLTLDGYGVRKTLSWPALEAALRSMAGKVTVLQSVSTAEMYTSQLAHLRPRFFVRVDPKTGSCGPGV